MRSSPRTLVEGLEPWDQLPFLKVAGKANKDVEHGLPIVPGCVQPLGVLTRCKCRDAVMLPHALADAQELVG